MPERNWKGKVCQKKPTKLWLFTNCSLCQKKCKLCSFHIPPPAKDPDCHLQGGGGRVPSQLPAQEGREAWDANHQRPLVEQKMCILSGQAIWWMKKKQDILLCRDANFLLVLIFQELLSKSRPCFDSLPSNEFLPSGSIRHLPDLQQTLTKNLIHYGPSEAQKHKIHMRKLALQKRLIPKSQSKISPWFRKTNNQKRQTNKQTKREGRKHSAGEQQKSCRKRN